jgi:hypothetical protein
MTPADIDKVLLEAAGRSVSKQPDPNAIERVKAALPRSLDPVRPLAPAPLFVSLLIVLFVAVAAAGAAVLGMYGFPVLSWTERVVISGALLITAGIAAVASAREMRPAGGRRMAGPALVLAALILLTAFAGLFHDYDTSRFIAEGVPCLTAGLLFALPAALAIWLLLRRGFVLDWRAAGIAAGTLAGLSGIGVLEIHCPILKAPHVMFWHLAVVLLSGIAGFFAGWAAQKLRTT